MGKDEHTPAPAAGTTESHCAHAHASVDSAGDERVVNNVMRHEYRKLNDDEKAQMKRIKDIGLEFHELLEGIGQSRALSLAITKVEEAVMWGVKHITA